MVYKRMYTLMHTLRANPTSFYPFHLEIKTNFPILRFLFIIINNHLEKPTLTSITNTNLTLEVFLFH